MSHTFLIGHHLKNGLVTQGVVYKSTTTPLTKSIYSSAERRHISPSATNKEPKEKNYDTHLTVGLWHSVGILPDILVGGVAPGLSLPALVSRFVFLCFLLR
jgi:hypothetical protein